MLISNIFMYKIIRMERVIIKIIKFNGFQYFDMSATYQSKPTVELEVHVSFKRVRFMRFLGHCYIIDCPII